MASCQTYTTSSHVRHPWFDTSVMKRKHRETVSPGEEDTAPSKLPPSKRFRFSNLEHGFAHMSLGCLPPDASLIGTSTDTDADMLSAPSTYPSTRSEPAYIVEEPQVPDVKMKVSSWYEPEPDRIVITDMDSFTQSDEEDEGSVSVNPALLDRIRNRTLSLSTSSKSTSVPSTSQALVLFKPLPLSDTERTNALGEGKKKDRNKVAKEQQKVDDDNAMDVEP